MFPASKTAFSAAFLRCVFRCSRSILLAKCCGPASSPQCGKGFAPSSRGFPHIFESNFSARQICDVVLSTSKPMSGSDPFTSLMYFSQCTSELLVPPEPTVYLMNNEGTTHRLCDKADRSRDQLTWPYSSLLKTVNTICSVCGSSICRVVTGHAHEQIASPLPASVYRV